MLFGFHQLFITLSYCPVHSKRFKARGNVKLRCLPFYNGGMVKDTWSVDHWVLGLPFQIRAAHALFSKFFVKVPERAAIRNG